MEVLGKSRGGRAESHGETRGGRVVFKETPLVIISQYK